MVATLALMDGRKTILITGATSGFGASIAAQFAKHNYNVIATGRREDRLSKLASTLLADYGNTIRTLCFDVRDREACAQNLSAIAEPIDILVNNAGLASGFGGLDQGLFEDWDKMLDTNVKGLLNVSKPVIANMVARKSGHIVNISSIAGKYVYKNGNVYCASKHAVDALSKSMRIDLLPHNIKVTSINPGAAETEFSLVRFAGDEQKAKAVYDGFTPLQAQDIADTVWYVCNVPAHVCINDLTITCTTQADSHHNIKSNEAKS
jgi:3-hydroxy acid dehydrogenase / malonic semialdehyde reductase